MTSKAWGANVPSISERDKAYHFHPQTNAALHQKNGPLIVDKGEGCYFIDDSGKRYLDMHAGLWCTSLGLSEPRLRDAAIRQFDKLAYSHTFAHKTSEPVVELAEALIRLAPVPMSKVQFQCSGSEANDTAVKMAWFYWKALGQPGRRKIISRTRAYHGTTTVGASMTYLPFMHEDFGLPLPGFLHVPHPDLYRGMLPGESDTAYAARLAADLEETIVREGPETIAAFIAEPVMGAGGIYPPPATYFREIAAVLNRYGILFIADEVICGFGRTGHWWGTQAFGLQPDIITTAKALSAAYLPISAIMLNEKVYSVLEEGSGKAGNFGHGFTYGGHPVCAAVAVEAIRIYEEDRIIERAAERGRLMGQKLAALRDHPLVGDVRGLGLMWGVELVLDKEAKTSFPSDAKIGARMHDICSARGLNTRALGGHTMALTPPLIISEAEIEEAVDIFSGALDELWQQVDGSGHAS